MMQKPKGITKGVHKETMDVCTSVCVCIHYNYRRKMTEPDFAHNLS